MTKTLRGLHLHFDCASGIAGDMTLGALLHLGVPIEVVGDALDQVGVGRRRLKAEPCVRGSVAAMNVTVATDGALEWLAHEHGPAHEHSHDDRAPWQPHPGDAHPHAHEHSHAHAGDGQGHPHAADPSHPRDHGHEHRHLHAPSHDAPDHGHSHPHGGRHDHLHVSYRAIRERISASGLAPDVKRLSLDIFDRLARAEATLHGMTPETVVFHEVGAIDSIVDIVGTAAAWCYLAPASASCASVAMGHGTLRCAHGVLPVPAPAALEILRHAGGVTADGGVARELCTPTGAAILAATVTRWGAMPTGRPIAIGWGAGDLDLADRPNVVRLTAVSPAAAATDAIGLQGNDPASDVWQIEANLDDMSPELCSVALDAAFAAGALDVWWTPITMKKGRPAFLLSALASEERRSDVVRAILRETTTIGLRCSRRQRQVLARRFVTVETPYGALPIKVAYEGDQVMNAAPELESCRTAAELHGAPVKDVMAAAAAAWARSSGSTRVIG
jgi:uncharacterized protein (TIGR00299 family) protein